MKAKTRVKKLRKTARKKIKKPRNKRSLLKLKIEI